MKKLLLLMAAVLTVSGCVGFVEGKDRHGHTVHDMYVLHPYITVTGYTSGL